MRGARALRGNGRGLIRIPNPGRAELRLAVREGGREQLRSSNLSARS